VLKAERQNDKLRVYFTAGLQALEVFSQMFAVLTGLANQMTISWQDIPQVVSKQADQLGMLQKELQALRQASIKNEALGLIAEAEDNAGVRLVRASFESRPITELRLLAEQLKTVPGVIAFLTAYDGQKVSLIVTCGDGSGKDARQLLTLLLTPINGRGGGDARLAQGGGVATEEQYRTFLQQLSLDK
jgi:alanyl-tRNA synthetase